MSNYYLAAALAAVLLTTACVPSLVATAGVEGGTVAAQERSAGEAIDDVGIRATINNLYINKDIVDLFKNVAINVYEGRVMLTGSVKKPETSVEAVRLAWQAKGVREVINEIQVNDKSDMIDWARDAWIGTQIRSRLLLEKNIRSVNYNIESVNGVVNVMGVAQNQAELDKVTYLASITPYVKQVVSHVIMKDDPRRAQFAPQTRP